MTSREAKSNLAGVHSGKTIGATCRLNPWVKLLLIFFLLLLSCQQARVSQEFRGSLKREIANFTPLDAYSWNDNDTRNAYYPRELLSVETSKPDYEISLPGSVNLYFVYADGKVYYASAHADVGAFDETTGKILWKRDLGERAFYGPYITPYFLAVPSGSPGVEERGSLLLLSLTTGKNINWIDTSWLIVQFLQDERNLYAITSPARIIKLALEEGKEVQSYFISEYPAGAVNYNSYIVMLTRGGKLFFISRADLSTEKVIFYDSNLVDHPVLCGDDLIFVRNNEGETGDRALVVFSLKSLKERMRFPLSGRTLTRPVADKDFAYLCTVDGTAYAFNISEGKEVWKKRIDAPCFAIALYKNSLLIASHYLSEEGLSRYRIREQEWRLYGKKPSWVTKDAPLTEAIISLDRKKGEISEIDILSTTWEAVSILTTPNHLIVFRSDEVLAGYPLKIR